MIRKLFITAIIIIGITDTVFANFTCKFVNTINITGGYKDNNGNFVYKNDVFLPGQYKEFDYVEELDGEVISVDPHMRGCVCGSKPCIRICCREDECTIPDNFTFKNAKNENIKVEKKYRIIKGSPCSGMAVIDKERGMSALNTGLLEYDGELYTTNDMCFHTENKSVLFATVCHIPYFYDPMERLILNSTGMALSIPFLIVTFFIYALISELRNLHGKCLMCYIFVLSIPFLLLGVDGVQGIDYTVGGLSFFAACSSCLWFIIMCYDLWNEVRLEITHQSTEENSKTFLKYCAYAFGIPLLITFLFIGFNLLITTDYFIRVRHFRWYMREFTIADAIYVYLPKTIFIFVTLALLIDTGRKLRTIHTNSVKFMRTRFYVYLCIFIPLLFMWGSETFTWLILQNKVATVIADFMYITKGLWIFLVCTLNTNARRAISSKCCSACMPKEGTASYTKDLEATDKMAPKK